MKKSAIIFLVILMKVMFWFLFKLQLADVAIIICEYLRLVPKGKQDLFDGLPKVIKITKVSFLIVEILLDIVIYIILTLRYKNYIYRKPIITSLIITFLITFLFVILTW